MELRWLIVAFAFVGMVASAILWYRPYIAPIQIALQTTGGEILFNGNNERPIPPIYLWLWGAYGVLAVATQFFLPAPWRFGERGRRTNWVLNITTVFTILLFLGVGTGQRAEAAFGNEAVSYREGGTFEYTRGGEVRTVTQEEAQQIAARLVHDQEAGIFKQWNMAALLSFLALGAYAAWWIIERPEAPSLAPPPDDDWLLTRARGETAPSGALRSVENLPSENARPREPASGDIPWR